jgi:hypothetical protein
MDFLRTRVRTLLFLGIFSLISKLLILSTDFFRFHAFGVADMANFEDLARHLAQGHGAVSTLNVNYSVYKITGVVLAILMNLSPTLWKELYVGIELILAVASSLMFYYLISLFLKNKLVCLMGAIAFILNPLIAFQTLIVSTESFYLFFFILMFIFMVKSVESQKGTAKWLAMGAGVFLGLTFYARPYILVTLPVFFIFWGALFLRHQKITGFYWLIGLGLVMVVFQLSLAPRIETGGGLSAPSAVRRALSTNLKYHHDLPAVMQKQTEWLNTSDEMWFLNDYLSFWLKNPKLYVESWFKSLTALYRMNPTQALHRSLESNFYLYSMFAYTLIEFILAIIGLGVMWRSQYRNILFLIVGISVMFSLFYAFTMAGQIRYRLQWEPLILVLTTFGIGGLGEYLYKCLTIKRS